jgi:hypothetical protein
MDTTNYTKDNVPPPKKRKGMAFIKCSQSPSALYFIIDDCEIHLPPKQVQGPTIHLPPKQVQGPTIPCTGRQQKLVSYEISYNQKFTAGKKWKDAFSELNQMSENCQLELHVFQNLFLTI